ncbi:reverse transcriptase [Plakobranchus ocellatus]|uniref:Reverse transcriptase n=1 Tax=Plakobranchus ocellatus TaxID=259542 RepID=A0AAV4BK19_9GAST|nr:reverse transcriptase [Plakobranchus ocellatus]
MLDILDKFGGWYCYEFYNIPNLVCFGYMLPLKAFMNDATICASRKRDSQNAFLVRCYNELEQDEFQLKKSLNLSIKRGKLDEHAYFKVTIQDIPRISQEPVKSLRG